MKKWEIEFDSKFNHFNEDKNSGKQICNFECEKQYDLNDVKKFIRKWVIKKDLIDFSKGVLLYLMGIVFVVLSVWLSTLINK